jgi:aryl-alcohol dehydrogenase-like predicted oxidoreductase
MEPRALGASGLRFSLVGLGCNNFGGRIDLEATRKVVHKAVDLGITHFDTADVYGGSGGSETFIGETLGPRRQKIVLATKFGKPMAGINVANRGSRAYVRSAVEASLKRLKTDWIDLLWMHEPDSSTPIEETLRAVDELVKAGKVRHFGASNFSAAQIGEAVATAKRIGVAGFIACQDEYSLLVRDIEKTLLPAMQANKLGLVPYFPLAAGALTGKYRKGAPMPAGARLTKGGYDQFLAPANRDKVEKLAAFAEARGRTLLELAMSWLARRPLVASIIAGATKPEQLEANAKATGWALTEAEMAEVDRITSGK